MHHPKFKHKTEKEKINEKIKQRLQEKRKMDADIKLYAELKAKLVEARGICKKISDKEKPSMTKLRIVPILNRITSYEEWFDGLADEEKVKAAIKKIAAAKKSKEGREKLLRIAASLPDEE